MKNFTLFKKILFLIIFLVITKSHAQSFVLDVSGNDLSLSGATIVANNGSNGLSAGSTFRYDNVITKNGITIYAILTVVGINSASLSSIDVDSSNAAGFQPVISSLDTGGNVNFKLNFYEVTTNLPAYLYNYYMIAADIDGTSTTQREYYRLQGYKNYRLNDPTMITDSPVGAYTQFLGRENSLPGITFENTSSFIAFYDGPKTSVEFIMGSTGANPSRQFGMRLGEPSTEVYTNPKTTTNGDAVLSTDLQIFKTVNTIKPLIGTNVTFTLTAKNLGPDSATNVSVADALPTGYTSVTNTTPTKGTFNGSIWTIGSLTSNETATITITAKVNSSGNYQNVAGITGDQADLNITNNSSTALVYAQEDTDGDGVGENVDLDSDNDGILNRDEGGYYCTSSVSESINSPAVASYNTILNSNTTSPVNINGLSNGLFNFSASLVGNATWAAAIGTSPNNDGGVQVKNNSTTLVGDYIYFQPTNTTNGTAHYALYTVDLLSSVSSFSFNSAGLNNNDTFEIYAYNGATAIPLTSANLSNFDSGNSWTVSTVGNAVKVVGSGSSGGTSVTANNFTTTINSAVTKIEIRSYKNSGSGNVTASLTSFVFCNSGPYLDTDGDGIPDYLDLDSDGDGCPDAIEGGASFDNSNLVTSSLAGGNSGSSYTGISSAPITVNLGNTVNATGVPTITGSPQTIGTSRNAIVNECCPPTAGAIAGNQTICYGGDPVTFTNTTSGTAPGVITYRWESATGTFATWTTISGATAATYDAPTGLTATTQYRRYTVSTINGVACESAATTAVTVTISPTTVGGSVASSQTICSGSTPADLSLTGNTGSVVKWQKSTDAAFTTPTDIASTSTTLASATIGALTANTYFRAVVQSGSCPAANSGSVLITIDATSVGGSVASAQTICSGSTPASISLTGNTGTVVKWQKSSDAAFTTPTDITSTSTTLASATIGALTSTTYFRAVVQSGSCPAANSGSVLITIDPTSVGGSVASAQTICSGSTPASISLTGNTGTVVKWQKSSDAAFTTPTDITSTSTTLASATIGALTANTYFRAVVQSGSCPAANSGSVLITIDPTSVGGSVASAQTICSGSTPASISLTGNTGTVVKWQKSSDAAFTTPTDIVSTSTTLASATIGALTANTYFRAVVQSGSCPAANSGSVLITVNSTTVGGTVSSNQTINSGSTPADLSLTGNTGIVVKWQKSSDAAFTSPADITSTSTTLTSATIGTLTTNTYFRAVVQNGVCPSEVSSSILITINTPPVATLTSSPSIVNDGSAKAVAALTATDADGTIASYRITTLPVATQGVLYLADGTTPVTTATVLTPTQAAGLKFIPAPGFTGNATFSYTATDNDGAVDATPSEVTIPVTNAPPTTDNKSSDTLTKNGTAQNLPALTGADSDGAVVAYVVTTLPPAASGILYLADGTTVVTLNQELTVAQAAGLKFAPKADFTGETTSFKVAAKDNGGLVDTVGGTVSILLANTPPIATLNSSPSIVNDGSAKAVAALTATDADGTIASYRITTLPVATQGVLYLADGITPVTTATVLTPTQAAGLTFIPAQGFTGNATFSYTATDNDGAVDATPSEVTIPVTNAPPTTDNKTLLTALVKNDTPQDLPALTGADTDGAVVAYIVTTLPPASSGILYLADGTTAVTLNQELTVAQAAGLTFAPKADFTGETTSFKVAAKDNGGLVD
ncbi:beta strand repeat-containing protein, partial [Flavobacterium algicola]|uniref:beta strand repeat-containing protein n=1 Tax=Flavobacterium algicola TaxID=556529 RepID=UPI001EFD6D94